PANMVLMTAGANFGYTQSLPFLVGVIVGKLLLYLALGLGLFAVLDQVPYGFDVLKYSSAAYVLYLSYMMSKAPFASKKDGMTTPPGFMPGLLVHPLNPKAYAMLSVAWSHFGPMMEGLAWRTFVICITFLLVQVVVHNFWCYAGDRLIGLIRNEKRKSQIQQGLAFLTALVVVWVVLWT
ncbi:MAG: LysE family transporter, partial [Alphaproteobacteria bacterium]|nr:LysE family transporter [Alphaproteobacteria bacterium]